MHENGNSSSQSGKKRYGSTKAIMAAEAAERESKLRSSYVVISPGDEAKPISCPICKETIKAEFLEEDEDWVWRNAVDVKGKVSIYRE